MSVDSMTEIEQAREAVIAAARKWRNSWGGLDVIASERALAKSMDTLRAAEAPKLRWQAHGSSVTCDRPNAGTQCGMFTVELRGATSELAERIVRLLNESEPK